MEGLNIPEVCRGPLEIETTIAEPSNRNTLLKEQAVLRSKEVGMRMHDLARVSSRVGSVCYRTPEQTGTTRYTRVRIRQMGRKRELVTEEAIELDGKIAVFENSEVVHLTMFGEEDMYGRDDSTERNITIEVPGATPQQRLDFLDTIDRVLDIIEAAGNDD